MREGDDSNDTDFEAHRHASRSAMSAERRAFLKSGFAATSGAVARWRWPQPAFHSFRQPCLKPGGSLGLRPLFRRCRDGTLGPFRIYWHKNYRLHYRNEI
jgi:hypothetical protein